jgi:hypothetical protein
MSVPVDEFDPINKPRSRVPTLLAGEGGGGEEAADRGEAVPGRSSR